MPTMKPLPVDSLRLDLNNFRTVHQKNETHAINVMISISPDNFWALLESILEDSYYPTENIILLESNGENIVKEGNRRIGALKIIFGYVKGIDIPDAIQKKIKEISEDWKKWNSQIPCAIYKPSESQDVDRIVSLIHAKGEKAGRDQWTAVARARYGRDQKGQSEPGLDLLEKYLKNGKNLSETQVERWSGDYPLTVLNEAIQKIVTHLDCSSSSELSRIYPKKNKSIIDKILYDIGTQKLGFKDIRDKNNFFGSKYGLTAVSPSLASLGYQAEPAESGSNLTDGIPGHSSANSTSSKPIAQASNDPKSVRKKLKSFQPRGSGRDKLVTLLNEIRKLKINDHPHAFCFLLRSMFEISAKAYCADNKSSGGPDPIKKDGNDKPLADLLREITNYITKNETDKGKLKELHGSITQIARKDGILSVTSMNQLVHNPSFSVAPGDISILFGNIFPLLEEMNK